MRGVNTPGAGSHGAFRADFDRAVSVNLAKRCGTEAIVAYCLLNSELHCVACYRFGQFSRQLQARHRLAGSALVAVHKIWNRWMTHVDHAEIHSGARIGPGLLIMHRHGILIGPSEIGARLVLHQNVTIGQRVAGGDRGLPRIGDGVWIGPGATITGGITVGDGSTISAGAVLSKSVPARSLVAGNPARVIASDYDNSLIFDPPEPE